MNKKRLQRKLEYLLEAYEGENRNSEKKLILKKLNEVEEQLGLKLTTADKKEDSKAKYFVSEADKKKKLLESLTPEEMDYMNQYNAWYIGKLKESEKLVKKTRGIHSDGKINIDQLVKFLNEGWGVKELGDHFGVHFTAITKYKNRHVEYEYKRIEGRQPRIKGDTWNGLTLDILQERLNNGDTDLNISKEYGIQQAKVSSFKNKMLYKVYKRKGEYFCASISE